MGRKTRLRKSTAKRKSPHDWLPRNVRSALGNAERRVLANPSYALAWERLFSKEEQKQLGGNLLKYCSKHDLNLIQVYMQLHDLSQFRATLELAEGLNHITNKDYFWLLGETGEAIDGGEQPSQKPQWDSATSTLRLGNDTIRKVKRPNGATNIIAILNAFESSGWPQRIEDPLPGISDFMRLASAVRSLNKSLRRIRFSKDGTGEGVIWRFK